MTRPKTRVDCALEEVKNELMAAQYSFVPFRSEHEGYAIVKEEVDEGKAIEFGNCKTDSIWMGFEVMSLKEAFKKVSQKVLAQGRFVIRVAPERH